MEHCNCVGHRLQIRGKKQMKKASRKSWRSTFCGTFGFLLVTLFGSHMIESQWKKISAPISIRAPTVSSENEDIRYNIPLPALTASGEKLTMVADYPNTIIWIINERGEVVLSTRKDISPEEPIPFQVLIRPSGEAPLSGRLFLRVL